MLPGDDGPQCLWWFVPQCTVHFLLHQRSAGTWVWYKEVPRAGHTLSISFSLVASLFVFLTDVLDFNTLFIFQFNFTIVNIVSMVQLTYDKVMMSGLHWALLWCHFAHVLWTLTHLFSFGTHEKYVISLIVKFLVFRATESEMGKRFKGSSPSLSPSPLVK